MQNESKMMRQLKHSLYRLFYPVMDWLLSPDARMEKPPLPPAPPRVELETNAPSNVVWIKRRVYGKPKTDIILDALPKLKYASSEDIAKKTGLKVGTVHSLLSCAAQRGLVERIKRTESTPKNPAKAPRKVWHYRLKQQEAANAA